MRRTTRLFLAVIGTILVCFTGNRAFAENSGTPVNQEELARKIMKKLISIRGLNAPDSIAIKGSSKERHKELLPEMEKDEATRDLLGVLKTLGLVEPQVTSEEYNSSRSGKVAGFMEVRTGDLYLDPSLKEEEATSVLSHELFHTIQRANFKLADLLSGNGSIDQELASRALIEGDATLTQIMYRLQEEDQATAQDIFSPEVSSELGQKFDQMMWAIDSSSTVHRNLRPFLLFPYINGMQFLLAVANSQVRKLEAINAVYWHPPVSTEQVLHPSKYLSGKDEPIAIENYQPALQAKMDEKGLEYGLRVKTGTLGELLLRIAIDPNLDALNTSVVRRAAEGWGGDRYYVITSDAASLSVLVLHTAWDSIADAKEFQSAWVLGRGRRFAVMTLSCNSLVFTIDLPKSSESSLGEMRAELEDLAYQVASRNLVDCQVL